METMIENIFFHLSEKVSTQGNLDVYASGLLVGNALLGKHCASRAFLYDFSDSELQKISCREGREQNSEMQKKSLKAQKRSNHSWNILKCVNHI